jgi:hypothetical protein
MSIEYAEAIAEQFVDWLLEENSPGKESLALFSLGLTAEGTAVRNTVLSVLRPMVKSHSGGVYSSKFPRETLLKLAHQAIERMASPISKT